jgi:ubiquinone/menaquinone biosynthesis C-methylase UbiE
MSYVDDLKKSYLEQSKAFAQTNTAQGFSDAVGGNFDTLGYLEKMLLKQHGLKPSNFLIDVGCGSGRLLSQLTCKDIKQYLGTDISEALLENCRQFLASEAWKVQVVDACEIPSQNNVADFVCMFSVITHLLHQQSYLYFKEAARVLKSGGTLILSFLEFRHLGHWVTFENSVRCTINGGVLSTWVDRYALSQWAEHTGFGEVKFINGEEPHIIIDRDLEFDDGNRISGLACLGPIGQSVMIAKKK